MPSEICRLLAAVRGAERHPKRDGDRRALRHAYDVSISDDTLERIVDEVTRRVLSELHATTTKGRWLTGAAACAGYMGCAPKRIYNRLHDILHHREGGRLIFHTAELDRWLTDQRDERNP